MPNKLDQFFLTVSHITLFILKFFTQLSLPPYGLSELTRQCMEIGVKTLPLITVTGIITGVGFTIQLRLPMQDLGATAMLPALVAFAIVNALAPLVTSLIAVGKIGSAIAAELSAMKISEQIDAMEVSAVNPYKYLVVSRVIATTTMIPVLTLYFGLMCVLGSFMEVARVENSNYQEFLNGFFTKVELIDFLASVFRSILFGFTIGMVACYYGFNARTGSEAVGKAANRAVITGMYVIFIEEMLIVSTFNLFKAA